MGSGIDRQRIQYVAGVALGFMLSVLIGIPGAFGEVKPLEFGAFEFEIEVTVPGSPEQAVDLFTGDVSPWWDHYFSEQPVKLFIEPKPGGRFIEIFDAAGNGAMHATVIYAARGKTLRLSGPFGFSGHALDVVCSLDFEAVENGRTRIKLVVRGAGEMQDGWAEAVEEVWQHFLVQQFKSYVESKHKT